MTEITSFSASALAQQIRLRKFSPREAVEAHLRRIERLNPALNAFVSLRAEQALEEARAAEAALERKQPLGPLHGVPVSIKSSIDVAGLPCETGSRLRAGHVPSSDAPLVARLRAAGAIVLGKTNTPEFSAEGITWTPRVPRIPPAGLTRLAFRARRPPEGRAVFEGCAAVA